MSGRGRTRFGSSGIPPSGFCPTCSRRGSRSFVEAAFYGERVLGEPARRIADGLPPESDFFSNDTIVEGSTTINTRLREIG